MRYAALAVVALAAWSTGARASAVTDVQVAQFFLAGSQLRMNVERGLRSYPPVRAAFERLGAAKGCEAWNAAFADEAARATEWSRLMVAAARATVPEEVLAAAARLGTGEGDDMLRPYRPEMLRAMMAAGAGALAQASANEIVARLQAAAAAAPAIADPAARSAEIDALMTIDAALCATKP